jgi:hypothetical protein
MKAVALLLLALAFPAYCNGTNPVSKVLDLLSGLQAKVAAEGESARKEFEEFSEWCEDATRNYGFEIKTNTGKAADLKAAINQEAATSDALNSKIEKLSQDISTDEADLKAATEIREKESADFSKEEKSLMEVIDTLSRATSILEQEMQKGGASLLQNAGSVVEALGTMVQASMLSSADATQLTALVQSSQEDDATVGEAALGAPAAAVYAGHAGGIIDTLSGLLDKAKSQLDAARQKETNALHNFQMLKQSLDDQVKFGNKDMGEAKKGLAESGEHKAGAEGDLETTSNALAADSKALADTKQDCMNRAQDYEASTKSRGEELSALAQAHKIISETTAGATSQTYGLIQVSFLQVGRARLSSTVDLAKFEAVRLIRDLAQKENSPALAQLSSRMDTAMRLDSGSADPFAKVKGLLNDMLEKLQDEQDADSSHNAYCEKEMAESNAKAVEKQNSADRLTTKIDQMSARSAQLKKEVSAGQKALAKLAGLQAEMDRMRSEENAAYAKNKPEMEQGLEGIKMALQVLRDYYTSSDKAHDAAEGAGTGIVSLLETCESDFTRDLSEMVATEESAAAAYEQETKDNAIEKATKEKDVEYKTKEYVGLDKRTGEATSDRTGVQAELDAVKEYLKKLDDMCIAKPDTYEERKRRRESELAGLKEALSILEGEASLLQRRSLRRVSRHAK